MNVTTVKIRLALKLETHWQQCEYLSLTRMIRTHTHTVYATHATVVSTGMKLSFRRSDNQPRKNAPKPPPCTLTRTTCKNLLSGMCVYVYTSQILTVIAESIVSNKVDIWMSSNFNLFTAHTHTHTYPGPSLHSQSQIRWQIRRLMLLGGRGVGVPPFP